MKVHFTPKEQQVVDLLCQAKLRKNIAALLNISLHTVDAHINHIHLKTGTTTTAELMLFISSQKNDAPRAG